jgi:hypothetical protein
MGVVGVEKIFTVLNVNVYRTRGLGTGLGLGTFRN